MKSTLPSRSIQPPAPAEPQSLAAPAADPLDRLLLAIIPILVALLVGVLMLGAIGVLLLARGAGALGAVLLSQHSAWYLTRASAMVSYVLLWWSMALGLAITNRMARAWPGGPTLGDLHEHASLLGVGFAAIHALTLLADRYIGYSLAQILIPFANTSYRPLWVGIGQISFYLTVLVTFTFYVRRWISTRLWRAIHYLSFAAFALALAHGVWSGTDSAAGWANSLYVLSALLLVGLTLYRVLRGPRGAAGPARLAQ
ncbi:MAG TPA: hypothetical protein PKK15_22745 [Kouleothrix sp.]|uniref:hypothetical protein n=1 Tax=Kouleothrix sp. TaxID=2779161 RepID=UPI002C4115CC|nr:hypothetical protein [Kouleothrix sp.]